MPDMVPEIDTTRPHSARVYDYYLGRPDSDAPRPSAVEVSCYGGVARKR